MGSHESRCQWTALLLVSRGEGCLTISVLYEDQGMTHGANIRSLDYWTEAPLTHPLCTAIVMP
jgi:hypothetical protein